MKTALVTGAGGFIGSHLVKKLKKEGYWVRGVDLKHPEFSASTADDFLLLDLRDPGNCIKAVDIKDMDIDNKQVPDEVYQLAADMGGMGFIESAECEIMHNSALINIHMIHACAKKGVKKYFFSSSACVYRNMRIGEKALPEEAAYPAFPDNEYGWEKLYTERMIAAFGRKYGMTIRIARFQNCYGPEGTWRGGREKAPAALCRKIAIANDGSTIDIWGDGTAVRSYTYIDDTIKGIYILMQSSLTEPANIGSAEFVSVTELAATIASVANKTIKLHSIPGPVGVEARVLISNKIATLGWKVQYTLKEGLIKTYPWIVNQILKSKE